ncbi:long-chain fatty acid--CoA ligase [Janthinobacterium tructae]|uniref:long-chain fatty acid--CoA ligase n=1 Tax=Janthinobacterium tructae TaxID=2590869 RepID=UPI00249CA20A|nr:long-chain fatty acid--CoA ligase [Janthinobacterium tructae]MDI3292313.1 long-chain fatty acid--CoA ligase [Janthinobacterium tructae]
MANRHLAHWPEGLPPGVGIPATDLFYNVEVSARRYPGKPYIIFYDTPISFSRFKQEAEWLAGWLEKQGVKRGDRVLLYMQNSPQFAIAYYAILRANAVVVPVNPMNMTAELRHCVQDSGARVALVAQDLYVQARPLLGAELEHILLVCYNDFVEEPTTLNVPDFVRAPRLAIDDVGATPWHAAMAQQLSPGPLTVGPDDLCVMPYTSGTTGQPKGCMHTHRSVMHTLLTSYQWFGAHQDAVHLAVLPLFHVTGMQGSMNGPMHAGCTVVLLPRWDRDVAAQCIERYRISSWTAIPTMLVNFLANPALKRFNLDSLCRLVGGGAAMPESVAQELLDRGIRYVEGYGLSETMGPSHINPPRRIKKQCLGIPVFDTHSIVVDPQSLQQLPAGEVGEILTRGPQVFQGYWGNPADTAEAFVETEGQRWFRTGDLARVDDDGYFFMVDRLKRMVNASGFKVWPAEVEALMYQHPAIQEACVIPAKDAKRGETVKAIIVLKPAYLGQVSEQEIIDWAHGIMAAYKSPRIVEFAETLPKSATGKILWRQLLEREATRSAL